MVQVSTAHTRPHDRSPVANLTTPRRGAILVVEDRDDVRQGLTQLLELHGFLVYDAATGGEALAHLHAAGEAIALVLLDLLLPGTLSGNDVRAHQLADRQLAGVPTVIVSACEPDYRSRARLQPQGWLEKPFHADALLTVVKRFVVPEWKSRLDE